jgi:UbiD family decarboxylase
MNLREFIKELHKKDMIKTIHKEVDVQYEIATILKQLDGTPLYFEKVKGFSMPVVGNICSTRELVSLGLQIKKEDIIPHLSQAISHPQDPFVSQDTDYHEISPNLSNIPILTYYPFDGGPYIASAVIVANDAEYGLNASYHRLMAIEDDKVVMRILPRHFHEYLSRGLQEFVICIGNSIPVLLASAVSTSIQVSELSIANALLKNPLIEIDGHHVPQSEIVMIAEMTGETHEEGPFLDLTETPDIIRQQPVAQIKKIYVKEKPVFHALLPGGLEHKVLMGMPREPTIYHEVSQVCQCHDVLITPGGCSWLHGVIGITKRHPEDGKKAIKAAFKGHKSMKHVFVVDDDINIHDPHEVEWAMATRFQGDKDMIIKKEKGSSLDPSSNLETRLTTKIGFDLTIPQDQDPKKFKKPELPLSINAVDYLD